ncbi:MAG: fructosamine kinase family protein [Deltaproteobacteria bacterium]|nr:fructosamine kinase family protein [Deltaproteobacteria bacterium]MCW5803823.1 fructosamine kinase family protein [Deltaproteobacteria bacterium]
MIPGLAAAVGEVARLEPIGGGDINDAYRATLADGRTLFVKTHADPPPGMFAAEADGLAWLAAGPLRVPRAIAAGERFLALEWLDLGGRRPDDADLGRRLAELHRLGAPAFGHTRDNYLATIPQPAIAADDGAAFWIDHRVAPVCELARRAGRMPDVRGRLETLRARPDRFGPPEPPARLHGDLWWGNVGTVAGAPVVFDPAVYGGHREVDLAMLALFGTVSERLAAAYDEVWPLAAGWRARTSLWQLYPLAVHAALFGGTYGGQVARILDELA